MKRLKYALSVAALLVLAGAFLANATGRFDQKLSVDKQAIHVLNRLTFGPRPGDVEQVRRAGVGKWIDQQLHPEKIAENPVLEAKLKALETLRLPMWKIMDKYGAPPPGTIIRPPSQLAFNSLSQQQQSRLRNGSVEERRNTLASLDPDKRRLVLAAAPPQMLEGLPEDLQQEAAKARQAEQEELKRFGHVKELLRSNKPFDFHSNGLTFPKFTPEHLMDLIEVSAVVLAQVHIPTILHPSFLAAEGIVPRDWQLAGPVISMPPLATATYANGITFTADESRLVVRDARPL